MYEHNLCAYSLGSPALSLSRNLQRRVGHEFLYIHTYTDIYNDLTGQEQCKISCFQEDRELDEEDAMLADWEEQGEFPFLWIPKIWLLSMYDLF